MRTCQKMQCRRLILTIAVINAALAVVLSLGDAHAQSATAQRLFDDGNRLMAAGKLAEACAAFESSNHDEPRAGTLLRLGECREKSQQIASAWSAYKDAENLATDPRKRQFAKAKVAALEPRLSYLTVEVSNQKRIPGLTLTRNGTSFAPTLWNRALPIDGGDYVVTGRAPGYDMWQKTVHVPPEGAKLAVEVPALTKATNSAASVVSPTPQPSNPAANSPTPLNVTVPVTTVVEQNVNVAPSAPPTVVVVPMHDRSSASAPTSSQVVPLLVGAGALTLFGGGLGVELWAESRYNDAKAEMMSQPRRDSLYNSANTRRYVAEGLAAGGIAAGGAALWLYLRDGNRERDTTTSASVRVLPTATGLAVMGQF
jgi:hypothetical protein